tara:strand:- start:58 stop:333 length:276 start_codon:yes stop_codon:yes gene_type:complete
MGYIKLKGSSALGGFSLVPADNVGSVKITNHELVIQYVTGSKLTIAGASNLVQNDVVLCLAGIDKMNGASGKTNEIIELSSAITGQTAASL